MAMDLGTAVAYLDLDLTAFNQGIESVNSAISGLQSGIENGTLSLTGMLDSVGSVAMNVGGSLTKNLTLPMLDFGKSAIQSYIDYESAFTGVKKTLDVGDRKDWEIVQLYQELSDAIEEMATRTASTAPEIAAVAEIAGQLGISAEDLIHFTETMVMLGDTTNLSSAEAAEALAKFINITGTSKQEIDKLGSSIVDLGNNFATNESDIVKMATRLASAGTIAGLTERDILALATAMSSVGIKAEAGGSSMSQTLTQIEKAVQMSIAGDEGAIQVLETLARVSGMSAEQFSSAWMNDPMTALTNFLYGLGDLDEQGESTVLILDELGMTGIRQSNMLKALGLAAGELERAVGTSNKAWEDNTALMKEAELRYGTTESQLIQLGQQYEILKREIAEMLLPVLQTLMDYARQLMDWWRGLSDEVKESIVHYAKIAAVVGPVLMVFGQLMTTVSGLVKGFQLAKGVFGAVGDSLQRLHEAIQIAKNGGAMLAAEVSKLYKVFFDLGFGSSAPIGAVVAGIALLAAGFVKAFAESQKFRQAVGQLFEQLGRFIGQIMEIVQRLWKALEPILSTIIDVVAQLWESLLPPLVKAIQAVLDIVDALLPVLEVVIDAVGSVVKVVMDVLGPALKFVIQVIGEVAEIIAMVVQAIADFIGWLMDLVKPLFDWFKKVKDMFDGFGDWISGWLERIFGGVIDFIDGVREFLGIFFGWLFPSFKKSGEDSIDGFENGVNTKTPGLFSKMKDVGKGILDSVKGVLGIHSPSTAFHNIAENTLQGFENGVDTKTPGILGKMRSLGSSIFQNFNDSAKDKMDRLLPMVSNVFNNVGTALDNTAVSLKRTGQNMFEGFFSAIQTTWNNINRWVSNAVNGIMNAVNSVVSAVKRIGGSHANGLDFVPYDGYIAELHKGERVLTKAENKEYEAGLSGNGGQSGDTFNFYNTKPDPYEYARQMKRAKREMAFGQ